MERMEHIRGTLADGERIVLEEIDGYLACHDRNGRKTLYGYFEMPTDRLRELSQQICYRLILNDGRKANVYTEVVPSNVQGNSIAEFHVSGAFRK